MSMTFHMSVGEKQLVRFLEGEYEKGTGIPVHLYSVVRADMPGFNKMLAITDQDQGVLFMEGGRSLTAYGSGNPLGLLKTLRRCGVRTLVVD